MKQKDIAVIAVIAVVSAVLSIVISNTLFGSTSKGQKAEVVQPISASFQEPDPAYFNSSAFDPTRQITIGGDSNTDPFKGTGTR